MFGTYAVGCLSLFVETLTWRIFVRTTHNKWVTNFRDSNDSKRQETADTAESFVSVADRRRDESVKVARRGRG